METLDSRREQGTTHAQETKASILNKRRTDFSLPPPPSPLLMCCAILSTSFGGKEPHLKR